MTRRWCALIVALTAAGWATADEPKSPPPVIVPAKGPAKPLTAEILIAKLAERVDIAHAWSGALEPSLDHLATQLGIPIILDLDSFKYADPPLDNAAEAFVGIEKASHQPYRVLFERLLKRIDGIVLVREDHYEVAARQIASRAADPGYHPEVPEY